jgi:hypothetical protein
MARKSAKTNIPVISADSSALNCEWQEEKAAETEQI